jgi:transcriptional regulator with XRE-family HTH domain
MLHSDLPCGTSLIGRRGSGGRQSLMVAGDSPAVARRRLRLALRRAREAAGRTQGEVAKALEWSLSKVNRIESGENTISNADLEILLRLLGVVGPDEVGRLLEDARAARRRSWWDRPEYRAHLNPATTRMFQFEGQASTIRTFQVAFVPGLLQTREYAASIIGAVAGDEMSQETRRARLETRMRRRRQVLDRDDPPRYLVILDEFVPRRTVGDRAVMVEQLRFVATVARRPNVLVRMLPRERATYLLLGAFTIFDLNDEENVVLYRESGVADETVDSSEVVRRFRRGFELMWDICLPEEATISAIEAECAKVRAALDRDETGRTT